MPKEYIIILNINIIEENLSQEFRLKNIDETKKYITGEIKQNELKSNNCK